MDGLGVAPLLDIVKIVKQLFNGSTSIEPHFAGWHQIIQEVDDRDDGADEQGHFDSPQIIMLGGEVEESRDKRRKKERKKEKQERKERKKKEKEERKERKEKEKEDKKKEREKEKKEKRERKRLLKDAERAKKQGLTAALAFMHSRGMCEHFLKSCSYSPNIAGIPALFQFDIDGDIGHDPNDLELWFGQPDLGLPSKEYYAEKEIRDLYRTTIEKMLLAIMEAEEAEAKGGVKFPPWPWPPWGGDDDDKKSENKTMTAARLSRQVLKFESDIAAAAADLYVSFPSSRRSVSDKSL